MTWGSISWTGFDGFLNLEIHRAGLILIVVLAAPDLQMLSSDASGRVICLEQLESADGHLRQVFDRGVGAMANPQRRMIHHETIQPGDIEYLKSLPGH